MELFKLSQKRSESVVSYSNRISDVADEYELNEITQLEIMIFICVDWSTRFRLDLRCQGEGITWQFIKNQGTGWDRVSRYEKKWQQQGVGHQKQNKPTTTMLGIKPSQKSTPSHS